MPHILKKICNGWNTFVIFTTPITGLSALYGIYQIEFSKERKERYSRNCQEIVKSEKNEHTNSTKTDTDKPSGSKDIQNMVDKIGNDRKNNNRWNFTISVPIFSVSLGGAFSGPSTILVASVIATFVSIIDSSMQQHNRKQEARQKGLTRGADDIGDSLSVWATHTYDKYHEYVPIHDHLGEKAPSPIVPVKSSMETTVCDSEKALSSSVPLKSSMEPTKCDSEKALSSSVPLKSSMEPTKCDSQKAPSPIGPLKSRSETCAEQGEKALSSSVPLKSSMEPTKYDSEKALSSSVPLKSSMEPTKYDSQKAPSPIGPLKSRSETCDMQTSAKGNESSEKVFLFQKQRPSSPIGPALSCQDTAVCHKKRIPLPSNQPYFNEDYAAGPMETSSAEEVKSSEGDFAGPKQRPSSPIGPLLSCQDKTELPIAKRKENSSMEAKLKEDKYQEEHREPVEESEETVIVVIGSHIEFGKTLQNNDMSKISKWTKNGKTFKSTHTEPTKIIIDSVSLEDEGLYVCIVGSNKQFKYHLVVTGTEENVSVKIGDSKDFGKTIPDGDVSKNAKWTTNGKPITSTHSEPTRFIIDKASSEDEGVYVCTFGPDNSQLKYQLVVTQ